MLFACKSKRQPALADLLNFCCYHKNSSLSSPFQARPFWPFNGLRYISRAFPKARAFLIYSFPIYLVVLAFLTLFCCRRKWNCTNKPKIFQSKEKGAKTIRSDSGSSSCSPKVLAKALEPALAPALAQATAVKGAAPLLVLFVRISATRHGIWIRPDNTPRTDPTWGQLHRPQSPDRSGQPTRWKCSNVTVMCIVIYCWASYSQPESGFSSETFYWLLTYKKR